MISVEPELSPLSARRAIRKTQQQCKMYADQIAALKKAIGFDNNRPVQPINGRVIFD